ncbi:M15 family metallopeptidase [Velocimicrobium porci]|uniref:M15 family metallopeptidase n=1 Tax=Velocimicrobium porci TaxID=2606634 RepID=A0A6L5Y329_9FIRM|nr:M15 family metallopeptidase [Velocimicrobium porci]MSS64533.1 M15 family metallopeptidase [Velocimicrobium porci]
MKKGIFDKNHKIVRDTITYNPDLVNCSLKSTAILVNKEFALPANYQPAGLVFPDIPFCCTCFSEKKLLRREASFALEKLFKAAYHNQLHLFGVSGYRSYERQNAIYQNNLLQKGEEHTKQFSATPGHSEHQTGLAIDVSSISIHNRLDEVFAYTPEGKWLKKHCHEFGYLLRYPKEQTDITGYAFEPWHIRYVGIELATLLYQKDMTLEEYYGYSRIQ